jgi:minor extracellular serine protease Vpr
VNTWDERSHPAYPGGFEIQLDTNRDGTADWLVFNQEQGASASTGVSLVYVQKVGSSSLSAFFFLDADLNSPNRVFTVPMSALGLTAASQFDFTVVGYDNYFSGAITDTIGPMTYTGGTPNYVFDGGLGDGVLPLGGSADVPITAVAGGATASPSQTGILLIHYQAAQGQEATTIEVRP